MRRSLTAAVLGLGLVGAASAQGYGYNDYGYTNANYNNYGQSHNTRNVDGCAKQRRDGQTGGAIVGGLIGALAGGAIGNNVDGGKNRYRRGYRGYGSYYGGYRGHRGYRGRSKNDNSGQVAAGAVIGGLLGAVAGSEVGKRNVNCRTYHDSVQSRGYRGDPSIAPPTRQAWPTQTQTYPVSQPRTTTRTVRTYPAPAPVPAPQPQRQTRVYRDDDLYGGEQSIPCEPVTRVTRLPDGRQIREEVQECQTGEVWYERDGERVEGYY